MLVFYYNKTLNSTNFAIIFDFRIIGKLKALVKTKAFKIWKSRLEALKSRRTARPYMSSICYQVSDVSTKTPLIL